MTKILDLQNIIIVGEFHNYIKRELDFPYYYGQNWDAFYDCMSEQILFEQISFLKIINIDKNTVYLSDLTKVLNDLSQNYASFSYKFLSRISEI
jgi:RNAse (barnase) inhibitor barstar